MKLLSKNHYQTILLMTLPLIFITNSFNNAFYGGLAFIVVALITYAISLGLNKLVSEDIKTYAYVLITLAEITVIRLLLNWLTDIDASQVALYITIAAINLLMMTSHLKDDIQPKSLILLPIIFVVMLILALLREVFGTGSLTLLTQSLTLYDAKYGVAMLTQSSGGFILAGILFASIQAWFVNSKEEEVRAL